MEQVFPLILLLGIMYFLLIRPQQRRVRAQRDLVASLQVGDEIVTAGGLLGRIVELDDEAATVETTPGVVLRFRRVAIAGRLSPEPAGDPDVTPPAED